MFKSFAASLLSAVVLARSETQNGDSPANAYVTELIRDADVVLSVYTYNAIAEGDSRAADLYEFHGDTHVQTLKKITSSIRYGWCIEAVPAVAAVAAADAIEAVARVPVDEAETEITAAVAAVDAVEAVAAADAKWDCQVALANLDSGDLVKPDPVDPANTTATEDGQIEAWTKWSEEFTVSDYSYTGTAANWAWSDMKEDALFDSNDSDINWAKATKKSYKECIKSTAELSQDEKNQWKFFYKDITSGEKTNKQAIYVNCAATGDQKISADADGDRFGVNNHWYRDFDTTQNDTDMQLSFTDDATKERPIFGFYSKYGRVAGNDPADRDCTGTPNCADKYKFEWQKGTPKMVKPISEVWQKAQQVLIDAEVKVAADKIAADKAAAEAAEGDDTGAGEVNEGKDANTADGATQIAAHTTAFIVAVSALAF